MTHVKICGLTTVEAVQACTQHQADFIGFVVYPKSPRHVEPSLYGELTQHAGETPTVLVTVNADDALLSTYLSTHRPTYVQCHGSESPERCGEIRAMGCKIIRALPVSTPKDLLAIADYREVADIILLDAKPETGELPGGNAKSFDWNILTDHPIEGDWMLSGGLNASNIEQALSITHAPMVDVSSGVESTPGVKDVALIAEFMGKIKN